MSKLVNLEPEQEPEHEHEHEPEPGPGPDLIMDDNVHGREYVEPTENDILCVRGGRGHRHAANMRYRMEILIFRQWYQAICGDRDLLMNASRLGRKRANEIVTFNNSQKTKMSSMLVDFVQNTLNGRFLRQENVGENRGRWYIVDVNVARRKVAQLLRE